MRITYDDPDIAFFVKQGAHVWDAVGARLVPSDEGASSSWPTIHISVIDTAADEELGEYDNYSGEIRITRAGLADCPAATIAHELGHAMGLDHVSDPMAIMAADLTRGLNCRLTLTDADLKEHARMWP